MAAAANPGAALNAALANEDAGLLKALADDATALHAALNCAAGAAACATVFGQWFASPGEATDFRLHFMRVVAENGDRRVARTLVTADGQGVVPLISIFASMPATMRLAWHTVACICRVDDLRPEVAAEADALVLALAAQMVEALNNPNSEGYVSTCFASVLGAIHAGRGTLSEATRGALLQRLLADTDALVQGLPTLAVAALALPCCAKFLRESRPLVDGLIAWAKASAHAHDVANHNIYVARRTARIASLFAALVPQVPAADPQVPAPDPYRRNRVTLLTAAFDRVCRSGRDERALEGARVEVLDAMERHVLAWGAMSGGEIGWWAECLLTMLVGVMCDGQIPASTDAGSASANVAAAVASLLVACRQNTVLHTKLQASICSAEHLGADVVAVWGARRGAEASFLAALNPTTPTLGALDAMAAPILGTSLLRAETEGRIACSLVYVMRTGNHGWELLAPTVAKVLVRLIVDGHPRALAALRRALAATSTRAALQVTAPSLVMLPSVEASFMGQIALPDFMVALCISPAPRGGISSQIRCSDGHLFVNPTSFVQRSIFFRQECQRLAALGLANHVITIDAPTEVCDQVLRYIGWGTQPDLTRDALSIVVVAHLWGVDTLYTAAAQYLLISDAARADFDLSVAMDRVERELSAERAHELLLGLATVGMRDRQQWDIPAGAAAQPARWVSERPLLLTEALEILLENGSPA